MAIGQTYKDLGISFEVRWNKEEILLQEMYAIGWRGDPAHQNEEYYRYQAGLNCNRWLYAVIYELWNGNRTWNLNEVNDFIRQSTPVDTGNLRNSWDITGFDAPDSSYNFYAHPTEGGKYLITFDKGYILYTGAFRTEPSNWRSSRYYAKPVEFGSLPHSVPLGNLADWVSRKIASGEWSGNLIDRTFALWNSIKKHGISSRRMIWSNIIAVWSLQSTITIERQWIDEWNDEAIAGGTAEVTNVEVHIPDAYFR